MVFPSIGCLAMRFSVFLAVFAGTAASSFAGFTVQGLGVLTPSGTSSGAAINASGQVAGAATSALGNLEAVTTAGSGTFQPIGPGGPGITSQANAINANNNVAGTSIKNGVSSGFYTGSGGLTTISPLAGGTFTQATGINQYNQVVGTGDVGSGADRAFFIGSSGTPAIINPLGTGLSCVGNGINNGGTIVGSSQITPNGTVHAFYSMQGGPASDLLLRNSAGDFSYNTYGMAIANNGDIAGYGDIGSGEHAFYAPAGGGPLVDLGVLPGSSSSEGLALNDGGLVVGESSFGASIPGQPDSLAFLWGGSSGMVNLNTLIPPSSQANWVLLSATGINDDDQITGVGLLNGVLTGFLLDPIAGESIFDPVITVPEPPAALLASIGLAIVAAWSKLRRGRTSDRAAA